jgi:O-antigen polysaccharide polymerase Wzy
MKRISAASMVDSKYTFFLIAILVVFGVARADSIERLFGYMLITATVITPTIIWLKTGALGIPILSVVAGMHFIFYALPILHESVSQKIFYKPDILTASFTVALYLTAVTIAGNIAYIRKTEARSNERPQTSVRGLRQLMFLGMTAGVVYLIGIFVGLPGLVANGLGVIRAVSLTSALLGCFILGHLRARKLINGMAWQYALLNIVLLILLSLSSLFLLGGLMFCFASIAGFALTTWRMPWRVILVALTAFYIFHAGKTEVRVKYWAPQSNSILITLDQVPMVLSEWVISGVDNIASQGDRVTVIDRASLLQLLLRVQHITPDYRPFLYGESYSYFPSMLIPRIIDEERTFSQKAMTVLNVSFGFQTEEAAAVTAIGWGVIAEGYANYGFLGVAGVGVVIGLIGGFFTRWSNGSSVLSIPTLVSIAVLLVMINLEADFSYLMVNMMQAVIATIIMFSLFKALISIRLGYLPRPVVAERKRRESSLADGSDDALGVVFKRDNKI